MTSHPNVSLRQLRHFMAAAQYRSFTRAAAFIGVSQPSLSTSIRTLEDLLGVSLFERSPGRLTLTRAGDRFLVTVRGILGELDSAVVSAREAGEGKTGALTIGVMTPIADEPEAGLLSAFSAAHPQVRITIHEANATDLVAALLDRRIDTAVLPTQFARMRGVEALRLGVKHLHAVLPDGHALAGRAHLDWEELSELPLHITLNEDPIFVRRRLARLVGRPVPLHVHPASKATILGLIALGIGATFVLGPRTPDPLPGLVHVPIDGRSADYDLSLVWRPDEDEPTLRRFVSLARERRPPTRPATS